MLIIIATVVFIDIAYVHALSLNTLLSLSSVVAILICCCYPLSSIIIVIVFVLLSTLILCLTCFIETRTSSGDCLYISSLLFPSLEMLWLSLLTATTAIDSSIIYHLNYLIRSLIDTHQNKHITTTKQKQGYSRTLCSSQLVVVHLCF